MRSSSSGQAPERSVVEFLVGIWVLRVALFGVGIFSCGRGYAEVEQRLCRVFWYSGSLATTVDACCMGQAQTGGIRLSRRMALTLLFMKVDIRLIAF
jgi:hypothetical protein